MVGPENLKPLIIVGASARSAAMSAIAAGYQPICVDLFADQDLQRIAPVRRCDVKSYPLGILDLVKDLPQDTPLIYTGAIENCSVLIEMLGKRFTLLGCSSKAVVSVRDERVFEGLPKIKGIGCCQVKNQTLLAKMIWKFSPIRSKKKFLLKPKAGAGGVGITEARSGFTPDDFYQQEFIEGDSVALIFYSDGWSTRFVGATKQLVGDGDFGASAFKYAGSIGPIALKKKQRDAVMKLAVSLTQQCDLRGVFGIDAIIKNKTMGKIYPVEINPRYTASVEVIEKAMGVAVFAEDDRKVKVKPMGFHGKAIVYAKAGGLLPDLMNLSEGLLGQVADISQAGLSVEVGQPICTVFGWGECVEDCEAVLKKNAQAIYQFLEDNAVH